MPVIAEILKQIRVPLTMTLHCSVPFSIVKTGSIYGFLWLLKGHLWHILLPFQHQQFLYIFEEPLVNQCKLYYSNSDSGK